MRPLILASIVLGACAADAAAVVPPADQVRAAIVAAVRARLDARADVRVEQLQVHGEPGGPFVAVPSPGARTGGRVHFVLRTTGRTAARVGDAEAVVSVAMRHLRSARPLARGAEGGADAVVDEVGDVGRVLLQPLPALEAAPGARAARDIARGEVLTTALLTIPALVKPGDTVVVRSSAGGLLVEAALVAAQAGGRGDVIRCVNPETRKAMAARILGRGVAEVVHAF